MKALLLLFVTFSFVPFAFSSRRLPASSSAAVVDIEGNELKLGEPYYAVSGAFVHPEGLCLIDLKNETSSVLLKNETSSCPHDVVQCTLFYEPFVGVPIIFSSSGGNVTADSGGNGTAGGVVKEDTSYSINFPATATGSSCAKDTAWGLASANSTMLKFVTTDPAATAVQFQLKKDGIGYKIAYCVSIPLPRMPFCYGIGFIQDGFYSRLGVGWGVRPVNFFFGTNNSTKHATSKLASY